MFLKGASLSAGVGAQIAVLGILFCKETGPTVLVEEQGLLA